MAELGRAALIVTLGLSLYALVAGGRGLLSAGDGSPLSARNALVASFFSTLVATSVLVAGFLRDDFSLAYVAGHSSRALPLPYKISAFWGGQEGSLLLWLLVLTAYSALAVWLGASARGSSSCGSRPCWPGSPWFSVAARRGLEPVRHAGRAADGNGLNPSLQNPYMVAHPVFLYLGYVGLAVPFAFAMGALLSGRTDERWIVATRRWTIVAWTALGIGQLLGAHWAYQEVGWGGYYAWDPVENAALMPWLAATAFLHSVMIQEKRGMLRVWNVTLVSLAFCLSLFGTFLTRSGVVSSIHSFTQSAIGPWFLGFIVVAVVFSVTMIWLRLPQLRTTHGLESLVSREATFLYNNLLLVALCLTILWGTAWPILSEAVRGESVVVGRPVLRLLPADLRAAAAAADGDRAARRVAARVAARRSGASSSGRRGSPSASGSCYRARLRLLDPGADRVHVLGVRPRHDRARVRARDTGRRALGGERGPARSAR